nr:MAG TPA: hypothetical protein [Caudoviricetes sp.]
MKCFLKYPQIKQSLKDGYPVISDTLKRGYFLVWVAYGWQSTYISPFHGKKTLILCGVIGL